MFSRVQGLVMDLEAGWMLVMLASQFIDAAYAGIKEDKIMLWLAVSAL